MAGVDYEKIADGVETPEIGEAPGPIRKNRQYLPLDHGKYQGIAEAKGYKQGDEFSGNRLQRVHYSHEAMIEVILAEPTITQNELAKRFNRSTGWISIVMGSDAFQAALAKRRDDLMDPEFVASLEDRFRGLADQSLRIISEKLASSGNVDLAVKGLEISSKALGFGARGPSTINQQNNYVVALPPKAASSEEWAANHGMKNANPQLEDKR